MWPIPRIKISGSEAQGAASARLIAFLAQHCGSVFSGFWKKRSKAWSRFGVRSANPNSRARSAALATTKLFLCASALPRGSVRDSCGASRSASRGGELCFEPVLAWHEGSVPWRRDKIAWGRPLSAVPRSRAAWSSTCYGSALPTASSFPFVGQPTRLSLRGPCSWRAFTCFL